MTKANKSTVKCPYCGNNDIGEYLYGLPIMDGELVEKVDSGDIILGGCCIEEDSPKYYCYHCEKNFGLYHKRKEKENEKDKETKERKGCFNKEK